MTGTAPLGLSREDDGVRVIHLRDPENNNAFTEALVDALIRGLAEVSADPAAKVLVLRGLPEVFCSGAPEALLQDLARGSMEPTDIILSKYLLDVPIPTIAACEGHAVGGGLALALCCDLILLARESRYGASFMNMGFTPGMGITRLLQDAVGPFVAAEMLLGGQFFRGSHFAERSAFNYVLPRSQVLHRAMRVAGRMAEKPRFALELLKRHLSVGRRRTFETARTEEAAMHQICFAHPETQALIAENYAPSEEK